MEIYEYKDPQGHTLYTDLTHAGVQLKQTHNLVTQTYNLGKGNQGDQNLQQPSLSQASSAPASPQAERIRILKPIDQQTFWNQSQIQVTLAIDRDSKEAGHIELFVDDRLFLSLKNQFECTLSSLDPGTHKIYAKLTGNQDKTPLISQSVTVYVHYTTSWEVRPDLIRISVSGTLKWKLVYTHTAIASSKIV